jgi:hypothetical protein
MSVIVFNTVFGAEPVSTEAAAWKFVAAMGNEQITIPKVVPEATTEMQKTIDFGRYLGIKPIDSKVMTPNCTAILARTNSGSDVIYLITRNDGRISSVEQLDSNSAAKRLISFSNQ